MQIDGTINKIVLAHIDPLLRHLKFADDRYRSR